jgi:antitoxin MazE
MGVNTVLKTRLVKIGNSQGIRIPKLLLDQVGFGEEVELELQEDRIVIRAAQGRRQGWDEQFQRMAEQGDDRFLDREAVSLTAWDAKEWEC